MSKTQWVILAALAGIVIGALIMHKWLTCEPCAAKRAALMRKFGLKLIE